MCVNFPATFFSFKKYKCNVAIKNYRLSTVQWQVMIHRLLPKKKKKEVKMGNMKKKYFQSERIMIRKRKTGWKWGTGFKESGEHRTSAIVSNRKPATFIHLVYYTTSIQLRPFPHKRKRAEITVKSILRWKERMVKNCERGDGKIIEKKKEKTAWDIKNENKGKIEYVRRTRSEDEV